MTECELCGQDSEGDRVCSGCQGMLDTNHLPLICRGCREHLNRFESVTWADRSLYSEDYQAGLADLQSTTDGGYLAFTFANCDDCKHFTEAA